MVDDDHRGYLMELIATKLLCLEQDVQIVGMSATLSVSTDTHAVFRFVSRRSASWIEY